MKALILKEYNRFSFEETAMPEMGEDDVLIAVKACGICGSDVHGMDGSTGRRIPPIIMGHEASGVVAEVGKKVKGFGKGDRVTFDSTIYCGECWFCKRGMVNLCDNRRVIGVSCAEYRRDGAFAEYVIVPGRILYKLPGSVTFEQAAMVEAVSIAVHALKRSPANNNDTAVVVGTGMIGLLVVQALRSAGCQKIFAADVDKNRLELAHKLGASEVFKSDACDVAEEIRKRTGGRGADVAIEVVGITPTITTAIASLRKGGSLTLVGNISPKVEINLQSVVIGQLSLIGTCASAGEYPECLDLISQKKVNVDILVSAVAPLSEGAAWFDRLYKKEPGLMKIILKP